MLSPKHARWVFYITTWNTIVFAGEIMLYTPSFPMMMEYFSTTANQLQQIVTSTFAGFCVGVIAGGFSDNVGRKPLLILGLLAFTLGSIGTSQSHILEELIIYRLFQGIGSGIPFALTAALFSDAFDTKGALKHIAMLNGTLAISLIFIPMLGNAIALHYDWRMNFYLVTMAGFVSLLATIFLLPETHPPQKRTRFSLKEFIAGYTSLFQNHNFALNIFIFASFHASLIIYMSNMSLIFVNHFGLDESLTGFYQAIILIPYAMTCFLGNRLYARFGQERVILTAILLALSATLGFLILSFTGIQSPNSYSFFAFILAGCAGFGIAYFYLKAIDPFERNRGSASAMGGALRHAIIASTVALTANQFDGTMLPVSLMLFAIIFTSTLFYFYSIRQPQAFEIL